MYDIITNVQIEKTIIFVLHKSFVIFLVFQGGSRGKKHNNYLYTIVFISIC